MTAITRRSFVRLSVAAPAAALWTTRLAPLIAAETGPVLDGDFSGGCCVAEGLKDGALVCRPNTPAKASGNLWYWFTARLTGARGRQAIELHWPDDDPDIKAKAEYGGNKNFATVLDRAINVSADLLHWESVADVRLDGQSARFTVDAGDGTAPLYIAVGMPWFARNHEQLLAECRASPLAKVTEIARTQNDQAVCAVRIGPAGQGEGTFYVQGYQHATEWAGARISGSMIRHLLSDAGKPLRERYVFHIVPAMNVGSLYGKGPAGNMNRDWEAFTMPETTGVRDYLRRTIAGGERLLHALDLHMGWSSRDSSGACLTASIKGAAPDAIIDRQERFARHAFARCDWTTEKIWRHHVTQGRTFASWVVAEFGVPAQTAEFSRHIVWDRASRQWVRVAQAHEDRLGIDLAEALGSFAWEK